MDNLKCNKMYSMATDPIFIGTGGYTIGRVDNTIVRDPVTKIPKIPGSSLAGTWRYFTALELISKIKEYQPDFSDIKNANTDRESKKSLSEKIFEYKWKNLQNEREKGFNNKKEWMKFEGNQITKITCAGQDNVPNEDSPDAKDKEGNTGHCGHCIVCKAFGFSKKDKSSQGMLFFSDLNILFFPVYTRLGVRWITSERILKEAGILKEDFEDKEVVFVSENKEDKTGFINLGWLNLPYKKQEIKIDWTNVTDTITMNDIVIVPDSLISQIINSNLEVRTSVSIDPITGAAKEGALFTSEAIPRGTVFYGELRGFKRKGDDSLPSLECVFEALEDSKKYYEILGIGGMTTRGFGRMKILSDLKGGKCKNEKPDNGGENNAPKN